MTTTEHRWWEDALALITGAAMCALGVQFLTTPGLITGQTAGLAVLLSYVTDPGFAVWFFLINLPFYILGWIKMGPRFVVKTFAAVALVSFMAEVLPYVMDLRSVIPPVGAALAGALTGLGLIVIFRHGASLGGVGILALFLQDRFQIQAGWVQLGFDVVLFAVAILILPWDLVLYSLGGAAIVNFIVAVNHRKDRYIGR